MIKGYLGSLHASPDSRRERSKGNNSGDEMNRKLGLFAATAMAAVAFSMAGESLATEKGDTLKFCSAGAECVTLSAQNVASVTVQSVTVRQLAGTGAGCMAKEMRHTANLRGRSYEDWFAIEANKGCAYEIKFVTPDGCTGNKTLKLTTGRIANGYVVAKLRRACGTLVTEADKSRSRYTR